MLLVPGTLRHLACWATVLLPGEVWLQGGLLRGACCGLDLEGLQHSFHV